MKFYISFILAFFVSVIGFSQSSMVSAVFFASGEAITTKSEKERVASFLQNIEIATISEVKLTGYCDDVGSKVYNETLSQDRAKYVESMFVEFGVPANRISKVLGLGEMPLQKDVNSNIAQQRKQNRRVDIEIKYEMLALEEVDTLRVEKNLIIHDDVKVGDKITLENILFIGGHNELLPESFDELEKLAEILLVKTQYHIVILGHVCCVYDGNDGEDLETGLFNLSRVRAETIYDYLIASGVAVERLSYKGLKAAFPTGMGDKFDRRVEIQITKIDPI